MSVEDDFTEHWPRLGERLFVRGSPGRDAEIVTSLHERMHWMKAAFRKAADLLVAQAEEGTQHEKRELIWPIVFCYRQYIELALKDVINRHGEQIEPAIKPVWNIHDLEKLWKHCKGIMESTLQEVSPDEIPEIRAMEAFIGEFQEVDAGSYAFRFPVDTKGNLVEIPLDSIDLAHLRDVMEGIITFFDCNEEVLRMHFGELLW